MPSSSVSFFLGQQLNALCLHCAYAAVDRREDERKLFIAKVKKFLLTSCRHWDPNLQLNFSSCTQPALHLHKRAHMGLGNLLGYPSLRLPNIYIKVLCSFLSPVMWIANLELGV